VCLKLGGARQASLSDDAAVFGVAAQAHPLRQFGIELRLRAKMLRVEHACLLGLCLIDLDEQAAAQLSPWRVGGVGRARIRGGGAG
jgi:hypothetical protein